MAQAQAGWERHILAEAAGDIAQDLSIEIGRGMMRDHPNKDISITRAEGGDCVVSPIGLPIDCDTRVTSKWTAAGFVVMPATQKPQSDVVPTALRDLIQLRVAYATTNAEMTDTILGAGMAQNGGEAHSISANERGVCFIVNEPSRIPVRARTFWVPDEEVEGIAQRYAHLRVDLPWLNPTRGSGGPTPAPTPPSSPTVHVRDHGVSDVPLDALEALVGEGDETADDFKDADFAPSRFVAVPVADADDEFGDLPTVPAHLVGGSDEFDEPVKPRPRTDLSDLF